jgi:hypothetical protein
MELMTAGIGGMAVFPPVRQPELSLGLWLVIKGFKPCPITAGMTAADTAPAYHDVTA